MSEDQTITHFVIVDHMLKAMQVYDDPQAKISNSEVLTMAVIAHIDFYGNYSKALSWIANFCRHLFPRVPDKSTFSKRLRRLLSYAQKLIFILLVSQAI